MVEDQLARRDALSESQWIGSELLEYFHEDESSCSIGMVDFAAVFSRHHPISSKRWSALDAKNED